MNKFLEVREFDSIIGNKDYENDSDYKYLKEPIFNELINFIHAFTSDEESTDVLEFMQVKYRRNIGNLVTVKNYVGLIQMESGYQIQILPKISLGKDDEDNEITKRIFIKMLRSMKEFKSKVFNDAALKISKMNIYEVFINMYLQEVRQLVKHGIKSDYVNNEDNLRFYKSKLMVYQHIKRNIAHKERFYVEYDEYQVNRVENRLIKATLLKLQKISSSEENIKEVRQLLTAFNMVDTSVNYKNDFSKVVIDRNTKRYETLMIWSKVFLSNKSFTTFSGESSSKTLLFPMEKVFEAYVAKNMKKIFTVDGWNVSTQDKGYYLFNNPRNQFALRPDIVMCKGSRKIILDTKWKKLICNERKNYGISQADMYQMYAYAKKYDTNEVWIIYPINEEVRYQSSIIFKSDDNVTVNIFFVDVENIEDSLQQLKIDINTEIYKSK